MDPTLFLVLACCCQVVWTDFTLTLLHTNDVHARFEQFNKHGSQCSDEDAAAKKCFGGFARRVTKVRELRETYPDLLFLDAGDQFQGTLWFYTYKGRAVSYFMDKIGYDVMSFGNHEFDLGIPGLLPFLRNTTVSIVSANIDATLEPEMEALFTPSKIIMVGTNKVGIIGYTTTDTPLLSLTGNLKFKDEVESIQAEVNKLKAQGVDICIALGHAGFRVDRKIAQEVDGIDVVIGGHTNTFLYTGEAPSGESPEGEYPTVITQDNGNKVLVMQDYAYGKYLGFIRITFDDSGIVKSWGGNPFIMDGTVVEDPATVTELVKWKEPLVESSRTKIGRSHVYLDGTTCKLQECNLGNLVTDAAVQRHLKHPDEIYWANVTMCLINGGGLKTSINQGDVTVGDVLHAQPYMNTVDLVQLKGKYIREILEFAAKDYDIANKAGKFLQMSGMKVTYNVERPNGQRVVKALVKCTRCQVPKYEVMDDNTSYKFITSSYMVSGGDGYDMIEEHMEQHHIFGDLDTDVSIEYIKATSPIITGIEGRIEFVTDQTPCTNRPINSASIHMPSRLSALGLLLSVLVTF